MIWIKLFYDKEQYFILQNLDKNQIEKSDRVDASITIFNGMKTTGFSRSSNCHSSQHQVVLQVMREGDKRDSAGELSDQVAMPQALPGKAIHGGGGARCSTEKEVVQESAVPA